MEVQWARSGAGHALHTHTPDEAALVVLYAFDERQVEQRLVAWRGGREARRSSHCCRGTGRFVERRWVRELAGAAGAQRIPRVDG